MIPKRPRTQPTEFDPGRRLAAAVVVQAFLDLDKSPYYSATARQFLAGEGREICARLGISQGKLSKKLETV